VATTPSGTPPQPTSKYGPPPEPTGWKKLLRRLSPAGWLAVTTIAVSLFAVTAVVTGILFGVTASETNPSTALRVMLDETAPYGHHLTGWAVALAIAGWIFIPVLIGAIASVVVEEALRHQRYPLADAVDRLQKDVIELKKERASRAPGE
jgi:hypothetical protein